MVELVKLVELVDPDSYREVELVDPDSPDSYRDREVESGKLVEVD